MLLIQELQRQKTLIYNDWIRYAIDDSNDLTIAGMIDSLKLEPEPELKAKLVELYLLEDSLELAEDLLDNIPLFNDELRQFYALMNMRISLTQDSGTTTGSFAARLCSESERVPSN